MFEEGDNMMEILKFQCRYMSVPYFLKRKNGVLVQHYKLLEMIFSKENVRMNKTLATFF